MTKTATTPAPTTTATLELIDPATAVIDTNVRTNPTLTEEFVQQIREQGVRVPVLARRGDDGTVYVWDGQRRLLAARAAGLTQIHAIFSTNGSTTTARITDQLTSFNRDDLDKGDRVQAIAQLALEGLSVDKIAKTTGTAKEAVASSIALAKSKTAREALDSHELTLDQALYIAEFEDDQDDVDHILRAAANGWNLDHEAQRLRDRRTIATRVAVVVAEYEAQGIRAGSSNTLGDYRELYRLTDAAAGAKNRPEVDAEAHTTCPGHAIHVHIYSVKDDDHHAYAVCTQSELHHDRWGAGKKVPVSELPEAEADARRAERRRLIANNKAWDSAETVRRNWLESLIARKTLPKDAGAFIAVTMTTYRTELSNDQLRLTPPPNLRAAHSIKDQPCSPSPHPKATPSPPTPTSSSRPQSPTTATASAGKQACHRSSSTPTSGTSSKTSH